MTQNSGILENTVTKLSENKYAIFPWVGTRQLYTLHYLLRQKGYKSKLPWKTSVYLEVGFSGTPTDKTRELESVIVEILNSKPDLFNLPLPDDIQIKNKYNEFIPPELLKKQYVMDFLDFDGLISAMKSDLTS